MAKTHSLKTKFAFSIICFLLALTLASSINFGRAQTSYYYYTVTGPYYDTQPSLNTFAVGQTATCTVYNVNASIYTFSLYVGHSSILFSSTTPAVSMNWNASNALNYTRFINFSPSLQPNIINNFNVFIPNPASPFSEYTFQITDFVGMTNAYLSTNIVFYNGVNVNSSMVEQISLNSAGSPSFVMQQYQTYTLTFVCDQGTYSQQFTAESTTTNSLIVLAGAFPTTNSSYPTADAERLNSTLIGIMYVDPSNTTTALTVSISHQSGSTTIYDYSYSTPSNASTILWNSADPSTNYNVNVTSTISRLPYVWELITPSTALANPWAGVFDWLGQSTPTMPSVTTGWPLGMTSGDIAEIMGGLIIAFFLTIGSFRSSGPVCIVAWIMSGFLIAFGWWGNGTVGAVSAIPEFALSGFIAILIQLDEAHQTVREV